MAPRKPLPWWASALVVVAAVTLMFAPGQGRQAESIGSRLIAPVLPGISDGPGQVERVVEAAVAAGATHASPILLHLRPGVRQEFLPWLEANRPDLIGRYRSLYRGSYAPAAERGRLSRRVEKALTGVGRPIPVSAFRQVRTTAEREPEEQLRLC